MDARPTLRQNDLPLAEAIERARRQELLQIGDSVERAIRAGLEAERRYFCFGDSNHRIHVATYDGRHFVLDAPPTHEAEECYGVEQVAGVVMQIAQARQLSPAEVLPGERPWISL